MKKLWLLTFIWSLLFTLVSAKTPDNALVVAWKFDDVTSLDPAEAFEFSGSEVAGNLYQGLVDYDINDVSKIYGAIADSWEVSEDGKTITFKLKQDLKFASGNPVTADDVVFSLTRAVKLNLSPAFILTQFGLTAENVDSMITKVDDYTVNVTLGDVFAPSFVLYCLTAPVGFIVDKTLVMEHEENGDFGNEWLKRNSAGSGSYVLKQWKPNEIIVLEANKNASVAANIPTVFIRHIPEASMQRLQLEKGDIDIARNIQPEQLAALKDNAEISIESRIKGTIYYLSFNQKNEALANPKVIEAIKYLVDYQGIADAVMKGFGVPHQTVIPAGFLGELDSNPHSLNVEKAKALLAEAGYADGFEVTLDVRNDQDRVDMSKSIQKTFGDAGIKVNILQSSGKQVLTKYRAREHDLFLGTWGADYQDPNSNAQAFAFNPDNSDDASIKSLAWRNAWEPGTINEEVLAAVKERDTEKRAAIYRNIQEQVLASAPFVIITQKQEVAAVRNNVKGYKLGPAFVNNYYAPTTKDK